MRTKLLQNSHEFHTTNFKLVHTIGECKRKGSSEYLLNDPMGLKISKLMNWLLICDSGNKRVQIYDRFNFEYLYSIRMKTQPQYVEIEEWHDQCGYYADENSLLLYITCSNQVLIKMKVTVVMEENEKKLHVEELWNTRELLERNELSAEYGLFFERFNQEYLNSVLYVCDSTKRRIVMLNALDGSILNQLFLKRKEKFSSAVSILIDSKKKWILVSEMAGQRVKILDYKTRQLLHSLGKYGKELDEFSYPRGIFLEEKMNRLYVCDASNNRISLIDLDKLEFVEYFGGKNSNMEQVQLKTPTSVVIDDSTGTLLVSDNKLDQVFIFR
ncbi:predicted protein [Naegleria gruberi]|uniref:Predicted protein n=1 Tax=Naegleria gruberi TaxID=5762 RepID=D2VXX0_NAEGR|nr:uncharacterized protein NAEGRDRAFT_53128 [Naegleria gruberi]EFC38364.1 predicted protein [Naegleria gruberi]|eukprot:XP_002671108.1 predicted protein [Naegleria gruberi strain NEG-M]